MRFQTGLNESIITFTTVPIKFGFSAAEEAGFETRRLGAKKILIVTDKNIMETGYPARKK